MLQHNSILQGDQDGFKTTCDQKPKREMQIFLGVCINIDPNSMQMKESWTFMIVVIVKTQDPGDSFEVARIINVMCQGYMETQNY